MIGKGMHACRRKREPACMMDAEVDLGVSAAIHRWTWIGTGYCTHEHLAMHIDKLVAARGITPISLH